MLQKLHVARTGCRSAHPFARSPVHPISRSPDAKKDAHVALPPSYGHQTHRKRCTLRTLSVQRTARLTPKDAPGAHRLPFRSPVRPISRSPDAKKDARVELPPSYGHQTHRKRFTLRTLSVQRTARLTPKDAPGAHRLPFRSPVRRIPRSPDLTTLQKLHVARTGCRSKHPLLQRSLTRSKGRPHRCE